MNELDLSLRRKIFRRLSITVGNFVQLAGLAAACLALATARSARSTTTAAFCMVGGWVLLYFSCHAIAHWFVGRIFGIRFAFYTVGGTGNPEGWPSGLRWLFEHLPFFGVQTEKASMRSSRPMAKAIMWSAGVTSSGGRADPGRVLGMAIGCAMEQIVSAVLAGMVSRNAGEQLDKPHRRLFQVPALPRESVMSCSSPVDPDSSRRSVFLWHSHMTCNMLMWA